MGVRATGASSTRAPQRARPSRAPTPPPTPFAHSEPVTLRPRERRALAGTRSSALTMPHRMTLVLLWLGLGPPRTHGMRPSTRGARAARARCAQAPEARGRQEHSRFPLRRSHRRIVPNLCYLSFVRSRYPVRRLRAPRRRRAAFVPFLDTILRPVLGLGPSKRPPLRRRP